MKTRLRPLHLLAAGLAVVFLAIVWAGILAPPYWDEGDYTISPFSPRGYEIRGHVLSKYLPGWHVSASPAERDGETGIILVDTKGKRISLPREEWTQIGSGWNFGLSKITDFVKSRHIKVRDEHEAIQVAKLIEILQSAPNAVLCLRYNTKYFTERKQGLLKHCYLRLKKSDWKYTPEKLPKGWRVRVTYVGPPASIIAPPTYEIDVDSNQFFMDIRSFTDMQ